MGIRHYDARKYTRPLTKPLDQSNIKAFMTKSCEEVLVSGMQRDETAIYFVIVQIIGWINCVFR